MSEIRCTMQLLLENLALLQILNHETINNYSRFDARHRWCPNPPPPQRVLKPPSLTFDPGDGALDDLPGGGADRGRQHLSQSDQPLRQRLVNLRTRADGQSERGVTPSETPATKEKCLANLGHARDLHLPEAQLVTSLRQTSQQD